MDPNERQPMTTQEAYERIRAHFSRPAAVLGKETEATEDAYDSFKACYYRLNYDPRSLIRCSFGVLIPDELYSPKMEGVIAEALLRDETYSALKDALRDVSVQFVQGAQFAHDRDAETAAQFVKMLDEIAGQHGLDVVSDEEGR